jgi:hypothetical protein
MGLDAKVLMLRFWSWAKVWILMLKFWSWAKVWILGTRSLQPTRSLHPILNDHLASELGSFKVSPFSKVRFFMFSDLGSLRYFFMFSELGSKVRLGVIKSLDLSRYRILISQFVFFMFRIFFLIKTSFFFKFFRDLFLCSWSDLDLSVVDIGSWLTTSPRNPISQGLDLWDLSRYRILISQFVFLCSEIFFYVLDRILISQLLIGSQFWYRILIFQLLISQFVFFMFTNLFMTSFPKVFFYVLNFFKFLKMYTDDEFF